MSELYDGLSDIFVETFGTSVIYTPVTTGVPSLPFKAIWTETSFDAAIEGVDVDAAIVRLHVRDSDVPDPQEGDTARRVKDGKVMKVATPIQPDGKGMIVCALVK
jgi:hypothetical protein